MKQTKPMSLHPKRKRPQVPFGYLRKNGRLVVDPRKKEIVQKLYGKYVADPEFLMRGFGFIAVWWHETNSRRAKLAYRQKLARQGDKS